MYAVLLFLLLLLFVVVTVPSVSPPANVPLLRSFVKVADAASNPVKILLRTFTTNGDETTEKDEHVVIGERADWQTFLLPVSTYNGVA